MVKKTIAASVAAAALACAAFAAPAAAPKSGEMVLIPAGKFAMGDTFNEGNTNERPVHELYVSAFRMDRYLVTKALWDTVYQWALAHDYQFDNPGWGKASDHPVHTINWYDMVKWCNARTEKEGLKPCYFTNADRLIVYRTGQIDLDNSCVAWAADGYRLPTEAEWEKAARGGTPGHRFPWTDTDTITHSRANYYSSARYSYDVSPTRGYQPTFNNGVTPLTSPVGSFAPNGYGLYDMTGNIWQWCWDRFDSTWYAQPEAAQKDTRGPAVIQKPRAPRVMRGGSFHRFALNARCAHRDSDLPDFPFLVFGFRCVRTK
jgi:sulfatase modifying factor 1